MSRVISSGVALLLALSLSLPVFAAGETGLVSREIDQWPSAVAMGQAAAANHDPLVAVWINPAGLAGQPGQVGATHTEWVLDTRLEQLAAALGGSHRLRFGVSSAVVTTGDIPLRSGIAAGVPLSSPQGYFEARDFSVGLSAAYQAAPHVSVGASVRSLTQKIHVDDASTLALDLGAQWTYSPRLNLGAVVSNLGPALDWGRGATVPLPRSLRAGASYAVAPQVTVASDLWLIRDRSVRIASGLEWHPVDILSVRTGYLAGSDSQNFTAGLGISYRGIGFDYALVPLSNDLGTTHRVALRVLPSMLRR